MGGFGRVAGRKGEVQSQREKERARETEREKKREEEWRETECYLF